MTTFPRSPNEDVTTLVMGRQGIIDEIETLPPEARSLIAEATCDFLAGPWAEEIVSGNLPDARGLPGIADVVLSRLRTLAGP